ncbi:hypothetical protein OG453_17885 [Streptomyces sp. NBC_01381]|uniref:hypothetical protein n=1 Tax=Streptomyces sp. NBC_01381 TaxID=2903845 RepID=UPI00224ECBA8|nr:hypothetical protein [Streptomyces sp. NBC_01381]MCX4668526.1 hypothetical protein [Streptomyces sp. NBC_01381]
MSTEARRTPVPPQPATPPPPPQPPAAARFPDLRPPVPPVDPDAEPADRAPDGDSVLGDLLAPFDRVRQPVSPAPAHPPKPVDQEGDAASVTPASPPPPPASARFPDAPPPSATTGTPGTTRIREPEQEPALAAPAAPPAVPPQPPVPPRLAETGTGAEPVNETAADAADYRLPPPVPPKPAAVSEAPSPRTAAARRAVGAVDLTPGPGAGRPFVTFARPVLYDDSTTRLRPVRSWARPRAAAAAACVVLGLGLIGGAATGSWLTGDAEGAGSTQSAYAVAGELWHSVPVDQLFPVTIKGEGAGPGGADRTWTRIAVAPDSGCKAAFDPLLRKALAPAGCLRLLRATYTDATRSHVTTVGLLFTKADADAMRSLRTRFTEEGLDRRADLMPRPYAAKGTPAAGFGDAQRASWTVSVLPDAPVVAFAVSGFADGRTVTEPEPAEEAMKTSATSAPAQAGLGNEAKGIADRVERGLRKTIAATEKSS